MIKDDRKRELAEQPVRKLLLRYSTPAIIGMIVNALYNLADAIFIGHGAGVLALGGVAISFPIMMVILSIAMTVGVGAASIISRALGSDDDDRAEQAAGSAMALILLLSVLITVTGILFLEPLLRLFGATDGVMPYARSYMEIIFLGSGFYAFSVATNNLVRAEGSARVAMMSMIIATGLNLVLDPVFIFGFGMGIRGAAIATVLSMMCSTGYLVIHYMSGSAVVPLRVAAIQFDMKVIPEMLSVGSSSFFRMVGSSIMVIVLYQSIGYYGTDIHLAAMGAINRLMMFVFMPMFGLVQGFQPVLGFNYGASRFARVRQSIRITTVWISVYSTVAFLLFFTLSPWMLALFSTDARLIQAGEHILRITVLMMPFVGFQMVVSALFQALGRARAAIFLNSARQIIFLIPLLLILPLFFDLDGVWYSFPVADALAVAVSAVFFTLQYQAFKREEALAEKQNSSTDSHAVTGVRPN